MFAFGVEIVAFLWLWGTVNPLSASLAVSATLFYVFVYSLWLKRNSTANIVIGGAAGAVPVLVGWSAVTNTLDRPPSCSSPSSSTGPHRTSGSAIRYRDDYQAADADAAGGETLRTPPPGSSSTPCCCGVSRLRSLRSPTWGPSMSASPSPAPCSSACGEGTEIRNRNWRWRSSVGRSPT